MSTALPPSSLSSLPAPASLPTLIAQRAVRLRAFNRFYTRRIGVLQERLLHSDFSLPECRVLWELAHHDGVTAATLARDLDLDPGYLSRLLRSLKERGLIDSQRAPDDARQALLHLTPTGRDAFAPLNERSQQESTALLARLPDAQQQQLMQALQTVEELLGAGAALPPTPVVLRPHRPGDIGWLISRHGALYASEYGLDGRFEALVAHIAGRFLEQFDPAREACWIADRAGEPLGCVCLVQARDEATGQPEPGTAQLRLLLVEPAARGLGLGARLVAECERFARQAGYQRIRLWTQSDLQAARAIYRKAGYRLVSTETHRSFGPEQVAENWELELEEDGEAQNRAP
ncbi:bifunctional helix-turn-helix transcriptional regulator/GNAT family N-acetyltransferase [Ideonella sp. BN130291]|uniref:bifunctional helix-turn-helix transcriptional regulator/GNAT family N-acetyltransferase n=1 Tax=Ideonella sp. BN130291 TaxID=3112940 RepID=UPI002E26B577|nr:helix-turn-helix domain-containing GNAT family N-acetyltransferase [Ideonella sp. BN130291]